MNALAYIIQVLNVLPQLMAAGVEITGFVQAQRDKLQQFHDDNRDPTTQEWDALNAEITRLRGQLHAP